MRELQNYGRTRLTARVVKVQSAIRETGQLQAAALAPPPPPARQMLNTAVKQAGTAWQGVAAAVGAAREAATLVAARAQVQVDPTASRRC